MTLLRSSVVALLLGLGPLATFGCESPPEPTESAIQALTVCHTTVVQGIDVSEFQGTVDWNTVHSQGVDFAIACIGDGTYHDTQFDTNWPAIRTAGMIRGAYLFFRPTETAAAQATAIANSAGTARRRRPTRYPRCGMYVSVLGEWSVRLGDCGLYRCRNGSRRVARPRDSSRSIDGQAPDDLHGRLVLGRVGVSQWPGLNFGSSPLWVSGYVSPPTCVTVPTGWSDWQIWQWTDADQLQGFTGGVPDGDKFNGTLAELQAFANGTVTSTSTWGGASVAQSFPYASVGPIMVPAGGSVSASITMRNSGTATWDSNTRFMTTQPSRLPDPFAGPSWVAVNRPASVPAGMTVAPGATYEFQFTFSPPPTMAPGTYTGVLRDGSKTARRQFGSATPGKTGPPDNQLEALQQVFAGNQWRRWWGRRQRHGSGGADDAGLTDASARDVAVHDAGSSDAFTSDAVETRAVTMARAPTWLQAMAQVRRMADEKNVAQSWLRMQRCWARAIREPRCWLPSDGWGWRRSRMTQVACDPLPVPDLIVSGVEFRKPATGDRFHALRSGSFETALRCVVFDHVHVDPFRDELFDIAPYKGGWFVVVRQTADPPRSAPLAA